MKNTLLFAFTTALLFSLPNVHFGQTAPNLGATSTFALFTASGAISNVGTTTVTGDVGTHVGALTGFASVTITGGMTHVADATTTTAAADVGTAYTYLSGLAGGIATPVGLGNGQTLTAGIYKTTSLSTLTGDLILDAQNNPNAVFILQIGGAFSTGAASNVVVINSASLCNVYWQVNGAVTLGSNSIFRGTIVADGAISASANASLIGRGLTRAGAINLSSNMVAVGLQPTASTITAGGPITFCTGTSVVLSGNIGGIWSTGATTPTITVTTSGDYSVTNTNSCSVTSNHIIVTIHPLPTAIAGAPMSICGGSNATLGAPTIAGHTYSWSPTTGLSSATIANPTASPTITTTYTLTETITATGCQKSNTVVVTVNSSATASIISAGSTTTFCSGGSVTLSGNVGGTWSNGAVTPTIVVTASGDYFITNTNGCGSVTSNHIVVIVNPLAIASVITANSAITFCAGGSVLLSGNSGGTWSNSAVTPTITVTTSGDYFVTNTNSCGSVNSNHTIVTVNALPLATTGNNATICNGVSVTIGTAPIVGHTYLWTPSTGLSSATIANPLANPSLLTTYTLTETITSSGCQKSNSVVVNPQPTCSCACN
jgi:hypothetical protein